MSGYDYLYGDFGVDDEPAPEAPPVEEIDFEEEQRQLSDEQAAEVQRAADAYVALLPEIRAARPQGPRHVDQAEQLKGVEWIAEGVRQTLRAKVPGYRVKATAANGSVYVHISVPAGADPMSAGRHAARKLLDRGNLGQFEVHPARDPQTVILRRRDIEGPGSAWRAHGPRPGAFHAGRDGQRKVFDLAGLVQKNPLTGSPQRPRVDSWGEDERGGTCQLALPPGMILDQVRKAEPALRQALNAPDLTVTANGVNPVLHLNTKKIVRKFPKRNTITADRLWLPKTQAERYACSDEVRLFLGVTETGEVVAPKLQDRSHAAVFGMTNSGKSAALATIARNLAAQGAEVWLGDSKGDIPLDLLYRENVPGITHLSAVTPALMHATVHKTRELYRFRAAVARELASRGVRDISFPRVVVILDELGEFLNTALSDGADPVAQEQAKVTVNMLGEIGAKARAYGVHLIVAGQHVFSAALPAKLKEHLSVRVVFGKASSTHIQRLYEETDKESAKAAREGILPGMKGRGIVLADEGEVVQFQSFYNDADASAEFSTAAAGTPRLLRWAHKFPIGDGPGANGAWQSWGGWEGNSKYEMGGTVEDIGTIVLDRRNPVTGAIEYDPGAAAWDMTNTRAYSPGTPPRSKAFTNVNN